METMVSATLRRQVRSVVKKKLRATCIVSVLAPCALASCRTSAQAAPKMRTMSKPGCSKNRLSSAESTAFTMHLRNIVEAHLAPLLTRAVE